MTPTLVIERPDLQAWRQKYGYAVLTFAFWGLYLYLWQPLLSLVLWSFGLGLAYQEMLHLGGFRGLLDLLVFYAGIICAMSAVFLGWGWINYLRFRGVDRRQAAPAVSPQELTEFFNVAPENLIQWRACKSLILHHEPTATWSPRSPGRGRHTRPWCNAIGTLRLSVSRISDRPFLIPRQGPSPGGCSCGV